MNKWIPEIDVNTRMWKCPYCLGRMIGESMSTWMKDYNPYFFCPYCGERLQDSVQDNLFQMELMCV